MYRSFVAAGLLFLASSAPAMALCDDTWLRGPWRYYEMRTFHDDEGISIYSFVKKCRLDINFEGIVREAECFDPDGKLELDWLDQTAEIRTDCVFRITTNDTEDCLYNGTIEIDRRTASGVGYCGPFDVLTFTMVRQTLDSVEPEE